MKLDRRLVLWGQRGDDIQLGSWEDAFQAAYLRMRGTMLHSASVYREARGLFQMSPPRAAPDDFWALSNMKAALKAMGREFDEVWK